MHPPLHVPGFGSGPAAAVGVIQESDSEEEDEAMDFEDDETPDSADEHEAMEFDEGEDEDEEKVPDLAEIFVSTYLTAGSAHLGHPPKPQTVRLVPTYTHTHTHPSSTQAKSTETTNSPNRIFIVPGHCLPAVVGSGSARHSHSHSQCHHPRRRAFPKGSPPPGPPSDFYPAQAQAQARAQAQEALPGGVLDVR